MWLLESFWFWIILIMLAFGIAGYVSYSWFAQKREQLSHTSSPTEDQTQIILSEVDQAQKPEAPQRSSLYRLTERLPQGEALPSFELLVLESPEERLVGTKMQIYKSPFIIGREEVDFNLEDTFISQEHARLVFDSVHQKFFLVDNDSSNGTLVNGEKASSSKGIPLREGAEIKLGPKTRLQFKKKQ